MFILVLVVFPLHEFKKKKKIYLCSTCVKGLVNVAHNTVHKQVKSLCKGPYTPLYTYLNEELDWQAYWSDDSPVKQVWD